MIKSVCQDHQLPALSDAHVITHAQLSCVHTAVGVGLTADQTCLALSKLGLDFPAVSDKHRITCMSWNCLEHAVQHLTIGLHVLQC